MTTEDYDVPLPTYSGRLSNDWTSHEARLKAWLRIKGVPTAAREAADILHLSLEPRSQAALLFDFASNAQRHSFDEGVAFMKTHFDSTHRKRLARGSAQNAMSNRTFRERGKRREYIKDLVGDLELLLLRAGIVDDWEKRQNFIRCFVEYPRALRLLSEKYTYDEVVAEALRWEATIIQRETDEYIRARVAPPPRPTPTRGERPASSNIPLRSSSPFGAGPSSQRYSGGPASPASAHGPPIPPPPTPASQAQSPSHHARQSSAPSTIEEATETLNDGLSPNTSSEMERPTAPTPSAEPYPTYSPRTTTPGGYDSITSRRSLSYPSRGPSTFGFNSAQPPNQYEADDYDFEDEPPTARGPPRSHSVDFDLRGTSAGRRLRLEDFERESEEQRSESTPPFVSDALHSDDEGAPQRSASALGLGGQGISSSIGSTKRKARKLVKCPSVARSSRDGRSESAASSSPTVSKPGRIRSWFGFAKGGKDKVHDGNISILDQDHAGTRLGLSLRGPWSRSMERLGRAPSPPHGSEAMGRPAKVRSGALGMP